MTNESKSWKDEKNKDQSAAKSAPVAKKSAATDQKPAAEATPQAAAAKPAAAKPAAATPAAAKPAAATPATAKPAAASPAPAQPTPAQPTPVQSAPAQRAPASPVGRQQVEVDDSEVNVCYANFCRVTGTPEELIIDFGLNTQPYGAPTKPIKVRDRVVTNMYTAKRMLHALHMTIQRHESAFGVLETDVQKRVVAAPAVRQQ